ncbi:hypothetical protein JCM14469_18790 [Desulfatiferula olefinivorans]
MADHYTTAQATEPPIRNMWMPVLVGTLLFVLVFILWWVLREQEQTALHKKVDAEASNLITYIEADMRNRIPSLQRIVRRWELRGGIPKNEFVSDIQSIMNDMPGFQAIEWVDKSYHVRWVVPLAGNEKAQDLNLAFEEKRRLALEKAKNRKAPTMTSTIDLVQGGKGFLVYSPIFVHGEFEGFVLSVFRIQEWLEYLFNTKSTPAEQQNFIVSVSVDDVSVFEQDGWHRRGPYLEAVASTPIMDHLFTVQCRPTAIFIERNGSLLNEFISIAGGLLSLLVVAIIFLFQKATIDTWRAHTAKSSLEILIQEHEKTKDELEDTYNRLALATKAGNIGVWVWDVSTDTLSWNDMMFDLYDVPPDVMPTFETWKNALHHEDRDDAVTLIEMAVKGKARFNTEFRIALPGGITRNIRAAARVERDNTGKPIRMTGVNWDITELKKTEKALHNQTEMQSILMDISSKYINISLDMVDEAVQTALAEMGRYVSADRVYVFDYDFKNNTTSNTYEWCNTDILPQINELQEVPLEGLADWVKAHLNGHAMLVPDVAALPKGSLKDILEPQNIKTLITVPMISGIDLLGFVGFDWVVDHYSYSDDEIKLLSIFSEILVNITLRKQADRAVHESEQRLNMALTGTNAGLWDWFVQTGETVFNERWAEIVGYTLKELEPTDIETWTRLCHPDDLTESNNLLQMHFEGKSDYYEFEARMQHKNGDWVWVADRGKVLAWDSDGKPLRMTGTHMDITERKKVEEKIRHMATHDPLTGLPSLILIKDRIAMALEVAKRKKTTVAILFVDLDGFKSINDNFGHDAGDFLLKEIAKRIGSCIREVDTVGRIGGDEFLLVLTELQSKKNSSSVAEKIIDCIGQPVLFNGNQLTVGASIGIAVFPDHSADREQLIKLADEAMYTIKNEGKNSFAFAASAKSTEDR